MLISATLVWAQTSDEKELLKFIADYDQAYIDKNIAFFEQNSVDEYKFSYNGTVRNRAQTIEDAKKEIAAPTEKMIAFKTVSDDVRVTGNTAIVSGSWMWSGTSLSNPQSEPHVDKGRYTLILEKRGGKWMLVAEHQSELPHDKKAMEAEVIKMGLAYNKMIERGDASEIEKVLADEYLYTNEKGEVRNKTEDLATYKIRKSKIESATTTDQKVRVIGNNTAIETGTFHVKGIGTDGKPFDETERYTSVWTWRGLRWQLVSDHTSTVAKP